VHPKKKKKKKINGVNYSNEKCTHWSHAARASQFPRGGSHDPFRLSKRSPNRSNANPNPKKGNIKETRDELTELA
jgi:hypothetical protein